MLKYNPKLKILSKNLRKKSTRPENILWQHLRGNQIYGLKFTRQKPIGDYILDFYCHKIKLAIELDGDQHFHQKGKIKDKKRDLYLKNVGIKLIRFPNIEIYKNAEAILDTIYNIIQTKLKNLPSPPFKKEGKRNKYFI